MAAPTNGTAATSRPVSELDKWRSASVSRYHGTASSMTAKAMTHRQRSRTGRMAPARAANGSRTAAPISVRPDTTTAGSRCRAATRMNRYGIPQITDIAANSRAPRRVTGPVCREGGSGLLAGFGRLVRWPPKTARDHATLVDLDDQPKLHDQAGRVGG